jgi:membrane-bound metal-dependent hydrolase YbcI (DUF457 family)
MYVNYLEQGISMRTDWFAMIAGEEIGPLTDRQLVEMVAAKRLTPFDAVRSGKSGKWTLAENVRGLFAPRTTEASPPATAAPRPKSSDSVKLAPGAVEKAQSDRSAIDPVTSFVGAISWVFGCLLIIFSMPFLSIPESRVGALMMMFCGLFLLPPIGNMMIEKVRSFYSKHDERQSPRLKTSAIGTMTRPFVAGFALVFLVASGLFKGNPNQAEYSRRPSLNTNTPAAVSEEAFVRMGQLANANDIAGIESLNSAGLTCLVPAGTRVTVIDLGLMTSEIKIEEGPLAGTYLFVNTSHIDR